MTALETEADSLWRQIIAKRFQNKCFFCNKPAVKAFPPHSAHHMIKRRFNYTRWNVDDGVYCCNECHVLLEQSSGAIEDMLDVIIYGNDDMPLWRRKRADKLLRFVYANRNPPIVRYTESQMQAIVDTLQIKLEEYI